MKLVRVGMLLCFSLCAALGSAQSSRSSAILPARDTQARGVSFRAASAPPSAASQGLSAASPVIYGSIATASADATPEQVFAHRQDVYLVVGPTSTPCEFAAYLPDGPYVFAVTDASGKTLLSTDPASQRAFSVKGGVIASYDGTTHTTGGQTVCGSLTIDLSPYNDAGSMNALYVAWVTPAAAFAGDMSQVDPVCGTGCAHGFPIDLSLTYAFRVEDKASCDPSYCASGVAYDDLNGNGVRDAGEPGLEGVPVRIESSSGLVLTTVTAADGSFEICGLTSGESFLVTSPAPLGFSKTGPANATVAPRVFAKDFAYIIEVCLGNVGNLTFPNQPVPEAIGGLKFQDTNANGVRDPGEPPLSGVTITLTPAVGGNPQTTTTAADGTFLFSNVAAGDYIVTEIAPSGFTQTVPASGGIPVTLAADGSSLNNLFGNFPGILTGTISGVKFNDLNGNGVRDPGEPGISGVVFHLDSCPLPCAAPPVGEAESGSDGSFSITGIPFSSSPYFLGESVPSGFRQTSPATAEIEVTIDFAHQTVTGLLFGNQAIQASTATISGTKFNDVNGNGLRDAGEPGLAGVTITLTPTSGSPKTTVTAADGSFAFTGLAAGTYTVGETVPAGFVQTAPGGVGTIAVTVAGGDVRADLVFGNQAVVAGTGSISGTKYFDIDANGMLDMPPDRPLEGVTMTLTDALGHRLTTVSAADGTFAFSNLAAGTYTLSETIPAGFAQTFPGTPDAPKSYTIILAPGQQATGFMFLNKC